MFKHYLILSNGFVATIIPLPPASDLPLKVGYISFDKPTEITPEHERQIFAKLDELPFYPLTQGTLEEALANYLLR